MFLQILPGSVAQLAPCPRMTLCVAEIQRLSQDKTPPGCPDGAKSKSK
jgi:hypothetical protein